MQSKIQSKTIRFVLYNYTNEQYEKITNIECNYIVVGWGVSKQGVPKLRGYIEFEKEKTLFQFNKVNNEVKWKKRIGSKASVIFKCKNMIFFYERGSYVSQSFKQDDKVCKYGGNKRKKLCTHEDCDVCFNRSFASHPFSKYLSKRNGVDPRYLYKYSSLNFWFNCIECFHQFEASLSNISKARGCPYCANQKLCGENCKTCKDKSFDGCQHSDEWSLENELRPEQVFRRAREKYWFICKVCSHRFKQCPDKIEYGRFCKYCTNQVVCKNFECLSCEPKRFGLMKLCQNWDYEKNTINPLMLFRTSKGKFWFICQYCKDSYISDICKSLHSGCMGCKNKTEGILLKYLRKTYPDIIHQKRFDWCKSHITGYKLPFDLYIPELGIAVELDGNQHFIQVMNWQDPNERRRWDMYKVKLALENGISVIRLLQVDVFYNKNNWEEKLNKSLYKREIPVVEYLADGNIYDLHIKDFKDITYDDLEIDELRENNNFEAISMNNCSKNIELFINNSSDSQKSKNSKYSKLLYKELRNMAQEQGIKKYYLMTKEELLNALE